jgi:UDP-2,4-diacetamido-2,4,6-trideoxy-beta-L-altropyranose hydrolase
MRVVIFPDANGQIGVGHVKRCLSLAEGLDLFVRKITFVINDQISENLSHEIGLKYDLRLVNFDMLDANAFINIFAQEKIDLLVVDNYHINSKWHKKIKNAFGCAIAAVDDLANRLLDVDFLIDQNIGIDHRVKYRNLIPSETRILGGAQYVLISYEYLKYIPAEISKKVESIGIFLGGTASVNLIKMVIDACRNFANFNGNIEIAITSNSKDLESIYALGSKDLRIKISVDQSSLAGFYAKHDFYIGAGGGSSWERCYMGVASVVLQVAENQAPVVSALSRIGAALTLNTSEVLIDASLGRLLLTALKDYKLRNSCSKASLGLIDGRGATRVAIALLIKNIRIRNVNMSDCETMYLWRSSPAVMERSLSKNKFSQNQHNEWFKNVIVDSSKLVLVGTIFDRRIGFIRFERHNKKLEVSIYLDPVFIGCGAGGKLLEQAEACALKWAPTANELVARVLPGNSRSVSMFQRNGYVLDGDNFRKIVKH